MALLATLPAPKGITPPRWRMFQATAARVLHDQGAELHAAGWDALDVFGLHADAPATNPFGWGLAWLLGAAGEVLDVGPDAVGMTREAGGARLALYKWQSAGKHRHLASVEIARSVSMSVPAQMDLSGLTAGDAEWFDQVATGKRAAAEGYDAPAGAAQLAAEAAGIEALAAALRDPAACGLHVLRQGQGGETAPPDDPDRPWRQREVAQTVAATPTVLAADASMARLSMARDAGVLTLAVEAAEDAGAATATERMLSHQLAAAHQAAMGLFAAAERELYKHRVASNINPGALAEATRSATAGARVLAAFAQGALALDRLRNGNRQLVTVQHVTVADGGQALIAGSVTTTKRQGSTGQ